MEPLAAWRIWTQLAVVTTAFGLSVARRLPFLRTVGACVAVLVAYGMLQDQVSARLCPEYFTVGHPPIAGLTDPTLLGLAWGFLGSWWGGLILGLVLAVVMRAGSAPPLALARLTRPLALMVLGMALVTLICGVSAYYNATLLDVSLGQPWATLIPPERHRTMLVVANAHFGTYGSAVVGGLGVCIWAVRARRDRGGASR